MRHALALLFCALALAPAPAAQAAEEQVIAGLSQSSVSITADFSGTEILVYGAVKREAPAPEGGPMRVIVTVQGPDIPVTVRRKDQRYGIWLNNASVGIDAAPSFYAVSTSAPLRQALSETEDLRHRITIPRAIRAVGISEEADNSPAFIEALLRIREKEGRYALRENSVALTEETLFRTDVMLPTNLTEGDYVVRVFLTRDGKVVDSIRRAIWVRKAGLERFLYESAHEQPLLYGLVALITAAIAGWGASALFARLRW